MDKACLTPDFARLFDWAPGIYLVLLPDAPKFTMVAANQARLRATMSTPEQTIGKGLFELFPDNPDDPSATGTRNLRISLNRVVETRQPDSMAVQKYDIPKPQSEGGGFEERYWSPINTPVLDETGKLLYIIHRVEDVTEFVRLKQQGTEQIQLTTELRAKVEQTETEVFLRAQDIQETNRKLQAAHAELERLYEQNKALDQVKTQFFANVSHEFRTPLTLILGPLEELLEQPALTGAQKSQLETVHRNALRLLKLVNTLLDFSRLESGRVKAVYGPLDLSTLTSTLASAFQSAVDRTGMKLIVRCPSLPTTVYVDKDMWEKIVLNLMSNAFKYTMTGEIEVTLFPVDGGVELKVRDTGSGIPEHELPHIFERFHRVEGAIGRTHEGTGIGLSLVQELVKLHGGMISVESSVGKGTLFTAFIPAGSKHLPQDQVRHKAEQSASPAVRSGAFVEEARRWGSEPASTPKAVEAREGAKKRVVVVDDNADMREYIQKTLEPDLEVIATGDGQQALKAIRAHLPDLVVSDVMMPIMDGIELLKTLRSDPALGTLPVILLSARAGDEATAGGIESGADDYVTKPFSAKELRARVQTQMKLSDMRTRLLAELKFANRELEAFSRSVSHDLRAPVRAISGFSQILLDEHAPKLDGEAQGFLRRIGAAAEKMGQLIDGLLNLSRVSRDGIEKREVDLSKIAMDILAEIQASHQERQVQILVAPRLLVQGDRRLLEIAFQNLLSNAWKFTSKKAEAKIEVGALKKGTYFVKDNGAGFDMRNVGKLFGVFQRLHSENDFEGSGVGLATVQRIIERHGGRIWAEAAPGEGATFYFQL
jgi:signal transduction histidine kinase